MHATLSHYHHHANSLTSIEHMWRKILESCINTCWVYSVESVSKLYLGLSVAFFIFFAMCGVVCVQV